MNSTHAVPQADDHAVISIHREMAQVRYDHRAMRFKSAVLVAFIPLFALLLAAELLAGLYLFLVLTFVVVLAAVAL